ncbi:MAG: T9SS type A sorting domain-containing protein [Bacteroidia bacterium]|nr:T9SS type A sorting domain-containing protein [Bacteroidia bacterium]MCF8427462.1 T9SS type A sorting domain-containing protein [Bacteroidia bacterium]
MNADEKVNKLFDAARNARPEMDLELLEQKIELIGNRTPKFKIYFNTKIIIAMSIIAVFSTLLVLYFNKPVSELNSDLLTKSEQRIVPQNTESEVQAEKETSIEPKGEIRKTKVNRKSAAPIFSFEPKLVTIFDSSNSIEKAPSLEQIDSITQRRLINLNCIKIIELSDEELLAFGIIIKDLQIKLPICDTKASFIYFDKAGSTAEFNMNFRPTGFNNFGSKNLKSSFGNSSNKLNSNSSVFIRGNTLNPPKLKATNTSDSNANSSIVMKIPKYRLVTDDLGQKWRLFELDNEYSKEELQYRIDNNLSPLKPENERKEDERKLAEKIPSFIPILVRSGDVNIPGDTQSYRADIIIWFEPSEELFNALPKRISSDLRKEYQSVFVTKKSDAKTCTYFEACQNAPGAINYFSAFPNPTDAELTVEFNLSDARILEANIYSINGTLLRKALPSKPFETGKHKFETNIGDLLPGVYVLVIESDKGDVISKRIVRR